MRESPSLDLHAHSLQVSQREHSFNFITRLALEGILQLLWTLYIQGVESYSGVARTLASGLACRRSPIPTAVAGSSHEHVIRCDDNLHENR